MKLSNPEGFVPVPGFPEYLMSMDGIFLNKRNRKRLKFSNEKSGQYPKVKFNHKRYNAHRFLAIGFIPNPENKRFVNHKDGNKFNCTVENLEWCTNQENMDHAQRTGLLVKGTQVHTNILDEIQVLTIRKCLDDGMTYGNLAYYFKEEVSTISAIGLSINWKHLPPCKNKYAHPGGYRKLSAFQVSIIKEALSAGHRNLAIANYFKISDATICDIKKGKTWAKQTTASL